MEADSPQPEYEVTALTALVVDDEPLARRLIVSLISEIQGIRVLGECHDGTAAIDATMEKRPDLVFLDIQMPVMDGMSVARQLNDLDHPPYIIFTTAFTHFAAQAFELKAIDFLIKPISVDRLCSSLERARHSIALDQAAQLTKRMLDIAQSLRHPNSSQREDERIILKKHDSLNSVSLLDITCIVAANQYVQIHTIDDTYIMSESLGRFEKRLCDQRFVRIHRSAIVNVDFIKRISRKRNGSHFVILQDGKELPVARSRSTVLDTLLVHADANKKRADE